MAIPKKKFEHSPCYWITLICFLLILFGCSVIIIDFTNNSELAALTNIHNIGGCEWQEVNELRKKEWFNKTTRNFYKFRPCKNSPPNKRRSHEKCCENLDEVIEELNRYEPRTHLLWYLSFCQRPKHFVGSQFEEEDAIFDSETGEVACNNRTRSGYYLVLCVSLEKRELLFEKIYRKLRFIFNGRDDYYYAAADALLNDHTAETLHTCGACECFRLASFMPITKSIP